MQATLTMVQHGSLVQVRVQGRQVVGTDLLPASQGRTMVNGPQGKQPEGLHDVAVQVVGHQGSSAPTNQPSSRRPPVRGRRDTQTAPRRVRDRDIVTFLRSQPGVLQSLVGRHRGLRRHLLRFIQGQQRVLVVGGEPGNGKSLFTGELIIHCRGLAIAHPSLRFPLALISYDRVHSLLFERLSLKVGTSIPLPAGETHPAARQLVSEVMREVLLFAILQLPPDTRILMEAPLIDHRGDAVVNDLPRWGFPIQIVIMHAPQMWERVLNAPERISERSVQKPAMLQIRKTRLQQRVGRGVTTNEQGRVLLKAWKRWLKGRDSVLVSWNPADDEWSLEHAKSILGAGQVSPDDMFPEVLDAHAARVTDSVLEALPDLQAFANDLQTYQDILV